MKMNMNMSLKVKMNMNMKINKLPLSLIESEILPRLPAKSVGRFMCVCKQRKSFLSTPMFARMHLRHITINDHKLLLLSRFAIYTHDGSTTIHCSRNRIRDPWVQSILASLDGLVCLASWGAPTKLAFWNPLTGAYNKLSYSGYPLSTFNRFAPIGFYKDSSNDYKLLYLGDGSGACIYSHRLDSWRRIDFSLGFNTTCNFRSQAAFCGQCLYFTVIDMITFQSHKWIICFDVTTENFRNIQGPPIPGGAKEYCTSLVVFNKRIHLCATYTIDMCRLQGDLWRMDGDGDGWVKMAAFPSAKHIKSRRPPICVTSNKGNWLAVLEENYSLKKMNTEDFARHYWDFGSLGWGPEIGRTIYVETLVSPKP